MDAKVANKIYHLKMFCWNMIFVALMFIQNNLNMKVETTSKMSCISNTLENVQHNIGKIHSFVFLSFFTVNSSSISYQISNSHISLELSHSENVLWKVIFKTLDIKN
jgi:hypothetical protein